MPREFCSDARLALESRAQATACHVVELGRIDYATAWRLQQRLVEARKAGRAPHVLLLCEHPHVFTLGRNGRAEHLRVPQSALGPMGIGFHRIDRGGDITYHGPGQIVGYPILHLGEIRRDVAWYVRRLEEVMIGTTAAFGVEAFRVPGRTGTWVRSSAEGQPVEEKLGAIGVHISRWVTSHGFAYNVSADLGYFDLIVPCGISGCRVASLQTLLRRPVDAGEVLPHVVAQFGRAFGLDMVRARHGDLDSWLHAAEAETAAVLG
jgi:lipoyl(octanoyl) transferase